MLRDDMVAFLGSFKNTESLSPELRLAIQTRTRIEDTVADALTGGRTVLVTGSAGSGKTHLLQNVLAALPEAIRHATFGEPTKGQHVMVVADATELSPEERLAAVRGGRNRLGTLMAINEGPLREAAALDSSSSLAAGVELLHSGQRGISAPYNAHLPTVVDMGAFDPLEGNVVADILGLRLLSDIVASSPCDCDPSDCPRRLAWAQLAPIANREAIADVVRLARLAEPDWLFRDIWDFVADLVLEGDCRADPPTSPWFWRLFYGDSRLSRALQQIADPIAFALPHIDTRLYFADWGAPELSLRENVDLLPISQPHAEPGRFAYVKMQLALLGQGPSLATRALRVQEGSLAGAVMAGQIGPILRGINEYMVYGLREGAGTKLDLVLEHTVRRMPRRAARLNGLLRLGEASSEAFELRSSLVLCNHPAESRIKGNRHFLVHVPSGASFELSADRLRLLHEGRSLRLSARDHVDLAWDLTRFFEAILRGVPQRTEFGTTVFDFERLRVHSVVFRADGNAGLIEAAQ